MMINDYANRGSLKQHYLYYMILYEDLVILFIDENIFKNKSGIYKIQQLSSGKIYIGQTKMKFIKRFWHHQWKLNQKIHDNMYLQNMWLKYGSDDFIFEIIEVITDFTLLNIREQYYIQHFNSFENGFNLTIGGEGKKECPMSEAAKKIIGEKNRKHMLGRKASEETKAKMRASSQHTKLSPERLKQLNRINTGSKRTEESKERMRQSHLGSKNKCSKLNEELVKEIKLLYMNGMRIAEIAKELNIPASRVSPVIYNIVWTHIFVEGWDEYKHKIER